MCKIKGPAREILISTIHEKNTIGPATRLTNSSLYCYFCFFYAYIATYSVAIYWSSVWDLCRKNMIVEIPRIIYLNTSLKKKIINLFVRDHIQLST